MRLVHVDIQKGKTMNLYEYHTPGGIREIKADCHVDPYDFMLMVSNRFDAKIDPSSIKQIYEAMRMRGKHWFRIRCDKNTFGAKPVTIGVVK